MPNANQAAMIADLRAAGGHPWQHQVGDTVYIDNGTGPARRMIVGSMYIQDGTPRYIVYPPGKKKSFGYHVWVHEKDVRSQP